jgi:hypothetical protein
MGTTTRFHIQTKKSVTSPAWRTLKRDVPAEGWGTTAEAHAVARTRYDSDFAYSQAYGVTIRVVGIR